MARHLDHRVWLLLLALAVGPHGRLQQQPRQVGGSDGTDGATRARQPTR